MQRQAFCCHAFETRVTTATPAGRHEPRSGDPDDHDDVHHPAASGFLFLVLRLSAPPDETRETETDRHMKSCAWPFQLVHTPAVHLCRSSM